MGLSLFRISMAFRNYPVLKFAEKMTFTFKLMLDNIFKIID